MEARCREDVFVALRARGIKPIKVVAADGTKANGEIRGVRKRVVAAIVCLVSVVVGATVWLSSRSVNPSVGQLDKFITPRHQIYGDPVVVEAFEHGRFDDILTNRLDQMLAWFAQPGKLMCPKGMDPRRCADEFSKAVEAAPNQGGRGYEPMASDVREVKELKQIVNGMHEEMAVYLGNGNGTPRSYWRRLWERLQQESLIFERVRRELENERNPTVWEEKNESLRRIGLRTIPFPTDK